MNLTVFLVLFLIGLIDNILFSFLYLIPVCSEGNIVDHNSAKHKLTWCCLQCCMIGASKILVTIHLMEGKGSNRLQCCMIGASNSLVTMKLIEGSNQMDYHLSF
jgi:hypothetical protein